MKCNFLFDAFYVGVLVSFAVSAHGEKESEFKPPRGWESGTAFDMDAVSSHLKGKTVKQVKAFMKGRKPDWVGDDTNYWMYRGIFVDELTEKTFRLIEIHFNGGKVDAARFVDALSVFGFPGNGAKTGRGRVQQ